MEKTATDSRPLKKAVSREELLLQWREQRRAQKQQSHQQQQQQHNQQQQCPRPRQGQLNPVFRPAFPSATLGQPSSSSSPHHNSKRVKVRVLLRPHHLTTPPPPNKPETPAAAVTLYDRGTVAWRLKSKLPIHHHHSKPPSPHVQPSSLPKERTTSHQHHALLLGSPVRRKSEPNPKIARTALVERSPNIQTGAGFHETAGAAGVAPAPRVPLTTVVDPWKDFDLVLGRPDDNPNWAISPMSSRSSSAFGSPSSSERHPPRHRSPRHHRPRHYYHVSPTTANDDDASDSDKKEAGGESRLIQSNASPILQERMTIPTVMAHFSHVTSRSKCLRSNHSSSRSSSRSVARSLSYHDGDDDEDGESESNSRGDDFNHTDFPNHRQDGGTPRSSSREEDRETWDDGSGGARIDEEHDMDLAETEEVIATQPMKDDSRITVEAHSKSEHGSDHHTIREDSSDSERDESPTLCFAPTRRSSASAREDSIAKSFQQRITITSPPQPQLDPETSYDWIDNLSPDEIFNRRVPSRRRTDFLPKIGSPLDRFRHQGAIRGEKSSSSSSMDSELEDLQDSKVSEDVAHPVAISMQPESIDRVLDQCSDIDSESDTSTRDAGNVHEGPSVHTISDTYLKVDGKTLLQPILENPGLKTQLEPDGTACLCSCCLERTKQWEEIRYQLAELKCRVEIAEGEKQKYQNQIYGIRKKYDARVTPFREVFEEMSKLKREKQSLLKENREGTEALESSVAALQLQMTEALTMAMKQNMELKEKLKDAESQIVRLQGRSGGDL